MRLPPNISVTVLDGEIAVCRLPADTDLGALLSAHPIYSVTRTSDELSLVCAADAVPPGAEVEGGWRALRVIGELGFTQVGLLTSLLDPLMRERVTVFVISTFTTDYVLVKEADLHVAVTALRIAGHPVTMSGDVVRPAPPLQKRPNPATQMPTTG